MFHEVIDKDKCIETRLKVSAISDLYLIIIEIWPWGTVKEDWAKL